MEITKRFEQPLLSRTCLNGTLAFDGATPSNHSLVNDIASSLKTTPSLVVVKKITTLFGKMEAYFSAVVYKDESSLHRYEVKTKKVKEAEAKAAKEAAEEAAKGPAEAKELEKPQDNKVKNENKIEVKTENTNPKEGEQGVN